MDVSKFQIAIKQIANKFQNPMSKLHKCFVATSCITDSKVDNKIIML
jgi:hypothetical protein